MPARWRIVGGTPGPLLGVLWGTPNPRGALSASGGAGAEQPWPEQEGRPGVAVPWMGGGGSGQEAGRPLQLILTWQGRYHDHEGGFPRVRLIHCTPGVLTPAISPNAGNSTA